MSAKFSSVTGTDHPASLKHVVSTERFISTLDAESELIRWIKRQLNAKSIVQEFSLADALTVCTALGGDQNRDPPTALCSLLLFPQKTTEQILRT